MLKAKILLDYSNLFFPNECEKNDKTILRFFNNLKLKISYINRF